MAILTREQIQKLIEIINKHYAWATWRLAGDRYVDPQIIERLKREGILPMDVQISAIKNALALGRLESVLKEAEWKGLTWEQVVKEATARQTPVQNLQIQAAELSAFTQFRNLQDDFQNGLFSKLSQATKDGISEAYVKNKIAEEIKAGVESRKNYHEVAKQLAETLKESRKNWHRIASTEMHAARQNGVVESIISGEDVYQFGEKEESNVAVYVHEDACSDCRRLYLDPKTNNPKIFKLSELLANAGTNYVRPWRQNAKPVVPPMHPHCFCRIRYIPPGWGWDEKGKYTMISKEEHEAKVGKSLEILRKAELEQAHSMLNKMSDPVPTEKDIMQISDEEQAFAIADRLMNLKKIHVDNPELYDRLEGLEHLAVAQVFRIRETNNGTLVEQNI